MLTKDQKVQECDGHHREGVFETPQGRFIARVKKKSSGGWVYLTLSQHSNREEAQKAYDEFKKMSKEQNNG